MDMSLDGSPYGFICPTTLKNTYHHAKYCLKKCSVKRKAFGMLLIVTYCLEIGS